MQAAIGAADRFDVRALDHQHIQDIANIPDNDTRAHNIALTYSRLAEILDSAIHGAPFIDGDGRRRSTVNANWFHFALWGTLTVTQNIGNQRSPQRLNSGLTAPLRRRLTPSVLRIKASDGQRVGRALAWGQRVIFISVCQAMQEYFKQEGNVCVPTDAFRPGARLPEDTFQNALQPTGATPEQKTATPLKPNRHEKPLRRAFELYALARALGQPPPDKEDEEDEEDRRRREEHRAKLVFGANLLLTSVEQDLVNRALGVVVDLVPQALANSVCWRLAKLTERVRGIPPHLSYVMLLGMRAGERRAIDTLWSRLMTDQVLVMALPVETLRLGRDIPPRHRSQPFYPPALESLHPPDPPLEDRELQQALVEVADRAHSLDRTVHDGRGSAARDWRRWDERMNWATTLLRSRQQDETLYWRPYCESDETRIMGGELPVLGADASLLEVSAPLDPYVLDRDYW